MQKKFKSTAKQSIYRGAIVGFLAICVVLGVFFFQYYDRLQTTLREESGRYLEEISRRVSSNIDRIVNDNFASLRILASFLNTSTAERFSDIEEVLEVQKTHWNCEDVFFIDEQGKAFNAEGRRLNLNNDAYFDDLVVNKKETVSTTQLIDNREFVVFAIPLDGIILDERSIVAIAASYDPATLNDTLSLSSFSGQADSCIMSRSGSIVIRPPSQSVLKFGYNILTAVEGGIKAGAGMERIREDLQKDATGLVEFTQSGARYYMVYTPISLDEWYLATFVPVQVVNEKSALLLNITLLACILLTMLFAGLTAFIMFNFRRNRQRLERIAYVDEVTGGHTAQRFSELAEAVLRAPNARKYAMVYSNIRKFKVLNDQFGRDVCDAMLKAFYTTISNALRGKECMGRFSADHFCILVEYDGEKALYNMLERWLARVEHYVESEHPGWPLPAMEMGIYVVNGSTVSIVEMTDRAKLALRETRYTIGNKLFYSIYDDEVRRRLVREKHIEDIMERALQNGEFQVYLQPKYKVQSRTIGGAEALTRWLNPEEGMIFPDEFIPLFEKNGFIVQLDLWVFEEVCRKISEWIKSGRTPVRVSVNVSRINLKKENFLDDYQRIALKYAIDPGYIEFEFTESVVMDDFGTLIKVIERIHAMGFTCSMDDFGSGYSSLNVLQAVAVDTLKLDKIFFRGNAEDANRIESVLSSVIDMAKALSMDTVAEGVEEPEQVDMLQRMGCDFIQGYVFARPMPIADFEKLAFAGEGGV